MRQRKLISVVITIVILTNIFQTYILLFEVYSIYFNRPEFSETPFKVRNSYSIIATITNFILLWGTTIWALIVFKKKNRLHLISITISILSFFILMNVQTYYPDSNLEWTENGHRYRIQKWYLGNEKIYKKWKSIEPFDNYKNQHDISLSYE